jgi:hypothetical protein
MVIRSFLKRPVPRPSQDGTRHGENLKLSGGLIALPGRSAKEDRERFSIHLIVSVFDPAPNADTRKCSASETLSENLSVT